MAGYYPIFPTTKGILRKLGGDKETTKTVLLDGVFEATPLGDDDFNVIETPALAIKAGKAATVNWNGKQYTCVAFESDGVVAFGNLAIVGVGDDTGEPFVYSLSIDDKGNKSGLFATTDSGSITVTVTSTTETIVPIDPKYLPGVCLPVVELSTAIESGTATTLSDAESAELTKIAGQEMPCLIKFAISLPDAEQRISAVFTFTEFAGITLFMASAGGSSEMTINYDGKNWALSVGV